MVGYSLGDFGEAENLRSCWTLETYNFQKIQYSAVLEQFFGP